MLADVIERVEYPGLDLSHLQPGTRNASLGV
jgi:hypothetical protein